MLENFESRRGKAALGFAKGVFAKKAVWVALAGLALGVVQPMPRAVAAEVAADKNYMGLNSANISDYGQFIFADAVKQARNFGTISNAGDTSVPLDANGWPTTDCSILLWSGQKADVSGLYTISFKGNADVLVSFADQFTATLGAKTYDSATNTATVTLNLTGWTYSSGGSTLHLKFQNTRRLSTDTTATGITGLKVMRPTSPSSPTSIASSATWYLTYLDEMKKFSVIRYMDWSATNSNGQVNWSDRISGNSAIFNKGRDGYGWEGVGGPWELAVKLANDANCDMWINVPAKANDDYVTKLAQLIKYGSDGTNPYTSAQANPVWPPLNSNLKVYVEYSNEVWNWSGSFQQSAYNNNQASADVAANPIPLNYDGLGNYYWQRRVAKRIVEISKQFRAVWGDSAMPMTSSNPRVRPILEWQYGDAQETASRGLEFMNNWYNNADGNHVNDPHPVPYYVWGGGAGSYYNPADNNSDTLTVDQILNESDVSKRSAQWNDKKTDIGWATVYGLKLTSYEGGLGLGDDPSHSYANKIAALKDSRLKDVVITNQNAWSDLAGDLLMYFESAGDVGYGHLSQIDGSLNSPKLQAIDALTSATKAAVTVGNAVPADVPAGAYQGSTDTVNGWRWVRTGAWNTAQNYVVRANAAGTYNLRLNYDGGATNNVMRVIVNGIVVRSSFAFPGDGTTKDSDAIPITLNAGKNGIRLILLTGDTSIYLLKFSTVTTPNTLTKVRYYPRSGLSYRMNSGKFQGSNTSSSSGYVDLATIAATPPDNAWSELPTSTDTVYRYLRYLSPNGGWGNVAEVEFYSGTTKLTGTVIGTSGSYNNGGADRTKAFDGDTSTYFDAPSSDGDWTGLDLNPTTTTPLVTTLTPTADATVGLFSGCMSGELFCLSEIPVIDKPVQTSLKPVP